MYIKSSAFFSPISLTFLIFLLPFPIFHHIFQHFSFFTFFLVSFFPISRPKFPGGKSLGGHSVPPANACYATALTTLYKVNSGLIHQHDEIPSFFPLPSVNAEYQYMKAGVKIRQALGPMAYKIASGHSKSLQK